MHEEVNQRVVSLCIRASRMTAVVLARALRRFLAEQRHKHMHKPQKYATGKQTLKQLMAQNAGATNIELDSSDTKEFNRIARKYHIDYAIKKDRSCNPPKYLVFFKSRDQEMMTMAFQEFVKKCREKENGRPSFRKRLMKYADLSRDVNKKPDRDRTHELDKEQSR